MMLQVVQIKLINIQIKSGVIQVWEWSKAQLYNPQEAANQCALREGQDDQEKMVLVQSKVRNLYTNSKSFPGNVNFQLFLVSTSLLHAYC